jgi:hypothetical protein
MTLPEMIDDPSISMGRDRVILPILSMTLKIHIPEPESRHCGACEFRRHDVMDVVAWRVAARVAARFLL